MLQTACSRYTTMGAPFGAARQYRKERKTLVNIDGRGFCLHRHDREHPDGTRPKGVTHMGRDRCLANHTQLYVRTWAKPVLLSFASLCSRESGPLSQLEQLVSRLFTKQATLCFIYRRPCSLACVRTYVRSNGYAHMLQLRDSPVKTRTTH